MGGYKIRVYGRFNVLGLRFRSNTLQDKGTRFKV